jgi:hypothetical protein
VNICPCGLPLIYGWCLWCLPSLPVTRTDQAAQDEHDAVQGAPCPALTASGSVGGLAPLSTTNTDQK